MFPELPIRSRSRFGRNWGEPPILVVVGPMILGCMIYDVFIKVSNFCGVFFLSIFLSSFTLRRNGWVFYSLILIFEGWLTSRLHFIVC